MDRKAKKIIPLAFLVYAVLNIFTYLITHISYIVEKDVFSKIFAYIGYYLSQALEFAAPPILAALMLIIFTHKGLARSILSLLLISSARIFYTIPSYYMSFIYTYDSVEAILFSALASLLVVIITVLGALISMEVAVFILGKSLKKNHKDVVAALPDLIREKSDTDFLKPSSLPVLVFVLLRFVFEFVSEIIDTVSFFVAYGSDYTGAEIFTMLINYILLFAFMVATYLISCKIKNYLTGFDFTAEVQESKNITGGKEN